MQIKEVHQRWKLLSEVTSHLAAVADAVIFFWVDEEPISKACEHCETTLATGINVYQWPREVCSTRLIQDGNPQLGGPGVVVEIDESCFHHKQKVIVILAKNSLIMIYFYCLKHQPPMQNIWVFGMVDTSIRGLGIVPDRTRISLLPIIQANTLPGTVIHADTYIHGVLTQYILHQITGLQLANCQMLHSTGLLITHFTLLIR